MGSAGTKTRRPRSAAARWSALVACLLAGAPSAARGVDAPPPRADEAPGQEHRHVGVGWKLGNGLGERGGELVLALAPRVAIELHLGFPRLEMGSAGRRADASGWGVSPTIRLYPLAGSPAVHVGAGFHHSRWTFQALRWSRSGFFANAGVEWRWQNGLRFLVGLGGRYANAVDESNATEWARADAGWDGNFEAGLRYMFF